MYTVEFINQFYKWQYLSTWITRGLCTSIIRSSPSHSEDITTNCRMILDLQFNLHPSLPVAYFMEANKTVPMSLHLKRRICVMEFFILK